MQQTIPSFLRSQLNNYLLHNVNPMRRHDITGTIGRGFVHKQLTTLVQWWRHYGMEHSLQTLMAPELLCQNLNAESAKQNPPQVRFWQVFQSTATLHINLIGVIKQYSPISLLRSLTWSGNFSPQSFCVVGTLVWVTETRLFDSGESHSHSPPGMPSWSDLSATDYLAVR